MISLLFFERDQDQDQLEESVSFIDLSLDSNRFISDFRGQLRGAKNSLTSYTAESIRYRAPLKRGNVIATNSTILLFIYFFSRHRSR